jgi:hypothetical protein
MKLLNYFALFVSTLSAKKCASNRRVVAIGDLHGDYDNAIKVLQLANIVNKDAKWIGKTTTLVQTGDIVDRGPDTIKLYKLMQRLTQEATAAGGKVVQLLGNHEIMNLVENYEDVTDEDIRTFGGADKRKEAFALEGWLGKHLRNLGITAIVDDTVYAHGGITPKWAQVGIDRINHDTIDDLHKMSISELLNVEMFKSEGPTQYRGYARDAEPAICKILEEALRSIKVNRMVLGHTVQENGKITARCGGRIILIDVGISKYKNNNLAALELTPGHAKGLYPGGKTAELPVPANLN